MNSTFHRLLFIPAFFILSTRLASANDGDLANIFVKLAKKMVPSVVNVLTAAAPRGPQFRGGMPGGPGSGDPNDLWRHFFEEFFGNDPFGGPGPRGPGGKIQSLGSGFVIEVNADGVLILTNHHVVNDADEVKIKFTESPDEKPTNAEVVGKDPELDVALLKVKTSQPVVAAVLGDSDALEQGEWVMAVGNPFGHGHSVSKGIVSAKERTLPGSYSRYLQVDAPINPGNSGGPLANLKGEVVGINNAVLANAQGIGFAIPINLVKKVLPQLKQKGHVDRGYIGVNIDNLTPALAKEFKVDEKLQAPFVTNVINGGPADKAGMKAYDVIVAVNGKKVRDTLELVAAITDINVGEKAEVSVLRQGKPKKISVSVDRRPIDDSVTLQQGPQQKSPAGKSSGLVGVTVEALTPQMRKELAVSARIQGVVVLRVKYGSPADRAGLSRGDIILEVDRKPVRSVPGFFALIQGKKTHLLRVRRQSAEGEESFVVVRLDLSDNPSDIEDPDAE
jgi:serine protease Do